MTNKQFGLIALSIGLTLGELAANAGTLVSYATGDVIIGFRKNGGANNLVVDAGSISTLTNATPNQRIPITQFTTNQLYNIGLNSISFSAFGWLNSSEYFITKARTSLSLQSTPHPILNTDQVDLLTGEFGNVISGAQVNRTYNGLNTDTAVLEPYTDSSGSSSDYPSGQSYSYEILNTGNYNGAFQSTPELTTPNNFATASTVVRLDLYQVLSKVVGGFAGSNRFLGYFELNTNGILTYVAFPSGTPTTPVITGMARTNATSYISFTTGSFGTYTLRGTNSISGSTAKTNWPAILSTNVSSAGTKTLTDNTSNANKFYIITAQ
jgi:hypothetical protein